MDWTQAVDGYCERVGPAFWAEPINAVTNAAFLIAAIIVWPRTQGIGRVLAAILFAIGVGSFLFHTFAQPWAGALDVLPIVLFILVYIYAANRDFWGLSITKATGLTALFIPYAGATVPLFALIPGLGDSAGYAPVPMLIALYAYLLRHRSPETARGLAIGAGLLVLSLTLRTIDEPLCHHLPFGTHFGWHLLNATMLGWMIEVHRRHMLAGAVAGR
ncbi:MAG: ceramidase domain-containing protein [Paracoccaceae bacterium]|nr:ceramidase domain-containing protein [Paracoccaceae bacterium]